MQGVEVLVLRPTWLFEEVGQIGKNKLANKSSYHVSRVNISMAMGG